jgi:hypothetical protein
MFTKTAPVIEVELNTESQQVPLELQGTIPSWLNGTLIRNGPVNVTVNGKSPSHWFDGLGMLHAFSFFRERSSTPINFFELKPIGLSLKKGLSTTPDLLLTPAVLSSSVF